MSAQEILYVLNLDTVALDSSLMQFSTIWDQEFKIVIISRQLSLTSHYTDLQC